MIAISAASVLLLIAVSLFVALYEPAAPTTFIESLSAAQRKEIPILLRKEGRRRGFLLLKRRQFKAAWRELRASNAQVVVAVGYEPQNTNKIWVHVGRQTSLGLQPRQITGAYTMTNLNGQWQITTGP